MEFLLPDVGEGLTEAEILTWSVKVGDSVAINDTLVEIETAKSVVELPSPAAGVIAAIHADEGSTVDVGTVIVSILEADAEPIAAVPVPDTPSPEAAPAEPAEPAKQSLVLVGTGPTRAADRRLRLKPRDRRAVPVGGNEPSISAAPPIRLLAKRLGVDLSSVRTRPGSRITREDVEAAATGAPLSEVAGRETRIPIKGVRKVSAAAVTSSAFTAPHVTEWLTVDVTRTMEMVGRLKADRAWAGVRITPLVFVARAFLLAARRFPDINATWDEDAQEIVLKHYVNLGIAAATPRGLMVPNIKDAHEMDLRTLADSLGDLVQTARDGKTPPRDMSGGTLTITNIGALGVDAGTPILNPGESAILAFGAVRAMPWVVEGEIVPRKVTQLAMSFDHRLVDGELGSNVLAEVGRLLGDPGETFLHV